MAITQWSTRHVREEGRARRNRGASRSNQDRTVTKITPLAVRQSGVPAQLLVVVGRQIGRQRYGI